MRLRLAALAATLAVLGAHTAALQPWTVDDAYISFRYAENAVAGHGLVFNPGEPVEGYTSFLWVVLLAAGHALGLPTEPLSKVLGVALTAAIPALVATAPRWAPIDERGAAAAALLAGTSGALTAWAAGGMEVGLVALLALAAWIAHGRAEDPRSAAVAGLIGGLGVLARPDLALVPLVAAADLALRRRWDLLGAYVLGAAALPVPHEAWRLATYGYPLPNTFYAKVGSGTDQLVRGLAYLGGYALPGLPVLVGFLAAPRWRAPLAWAALHLAYVVAVGGDGLPAWRFVAPVVPVLAVGAGIVLQRRPVLALPLAAWQLAALWLDPEQNQRVVEGNVGRNGAEVGRFLGGLLPPGTLIATNTAGSVPYFSGLPAIDMLGLNDAHIAHRDMPRMGRRKAGHEKADGAYVLSRDPEVILFGAARGRKDPFFVSDRELWNLPEFHERYVLETHALPTGRRVVLWRRRR